MSSVDALLKDGHKETDDLREKMNTLVNKCRTSIYEFVNSEKLSNLLKDSSLLEYLFYIDQYIIS